MVIKHIKLIKVVIMHIKLIKVIRHIKLIIIQQIIIMGQLNLLVIKLVIGHIILIIIIIQLKVNCELLI